jgi:hypothetical protein
MVEVLSERSTLTISKRLTCFICVKFYGWGSLAAFNGIINQYLVPEGRGIFNEFKMGRMRLVDIMFFL